MKEMKKGRTGGREEGSGREGTGTMEWEEGGIGRGGRKWEEGRKGGREEGRKGRREQMRHEGRDQGSGREGQESMRMRLERLSLAERPSLTLVFSIYTTKIDGVVCPPNISETVALEP